jgi:hypothetical protein
MCWCVPSGYFFIQVWLINHRHFTNKQNIFKVEEIMFIVHEKGDTNIGIDVEYIGFSMFTHIANRTLGGGAPELRTVSITVPRFAPPGGAMNVILEGGTKFCFSVSPNAVPGRTVDLTVPSGNADSFDIEQLYSAFEQVLMFSVAFRKAFSVTRS